MEPLDRDVLLLCLKEQIKNTRAIQKIALKYPEHDELWGFLENSATAEKNLQDVREKLTVAESEVPVLQPLPEAINLSDFVRV